MASVSEGLLARIAGTIETLEETEAVAVRCAKEGVSPNEFLQLSPADHVLRRSVWVGTMSNVNGWHGRIKKAAKEAVR